MCFFYQYISIGGIGNPIIDFSETYSFFMKYLLLGACKEYILMLLMIEELINLMFQNHFNENNDFCNSQKKRQVSSEVKRCFEE